MSALVGITTVSSPAHVVIQAQALFQVLDHALRKSEDQRRVIGTLLGVRSEDGLEVEIRSAYSIPHIETEDQVEIGIDYNRTMYQLHLRANPKEVILGWYATSNELSNLSGLVQDFYSQHNVEGTYPYPAIHLTVGDNLSGANPTAGIDIRTYISSPVGLGRGTVGNSLFVPIPNEVRYSEVEKSALDVISQGKGDETRTVSLTSDVRALEASLVEVIDMLERVSAYVNRVIDGSEQGNTAIGKYLLSTLSLVPSLSKDTLEKLFNSHLQDVLMVVYLANTVKTQLQLSAKLTPLV